MKKILIGEMSWPDFKDYIKENEIIIIPVGVVEEHGHHNPLGTDTLIAEKAAVQIGEASGTAVAPVIPYGYTKNITDFPGTLTLDPLLYRRLLRAYAESFIKHGVKKILFINGHGGNTSLLQMVARDLFEAHGVYCVFNQWWEVLPVINKEWDCNDHGGYFETSLMLAVNRKIVNMSKAKDAESFSLTEKLVYSHGWEFDGAKLNIPSNMYNLTKIGNVGNSPKNASSEIGEKMLSAYVKFNVGLIEEIKKVKLDG